MSKAAWFCLAQALTASTSVRPVAQGRPSQPVSTGGPSSQAVLGKYCVSCHNQRLEVAGLALDSLNPDEIGADAPSWEKAVRKLRSGVMPPAGRPRPDAATYDALASHLEARLDRAAATHPNPGKLPLLHRLTRTEYKNAVRDLLALDDLSQDADRDLLLPADNASSGFDNIAELFFVSAPQAQFLIKSPSEGKS